MRAAATVGGVMPSTATLMKRNDQPQMNASRRSRRMGEASLPASLASPAVRRPATTLRSMSRSMLERRLSEVSDRLRALRDELRIAEEQLAALGEAADDARLRALVSETPLAEHEHAEAQKHADAMARHRDIVVADIAELEKTQDDLLDRLIAQSR